MRDKIEELLDMSDPMTKSHYMIWDSGDCSEVGLCEILLDQLIRKHKKDNGEYYDTDYDQIKLRYQTKMSKEYKLRYEDRFHITGRGDTITVRWEDNDCENIKPGDTITELVRIRDGESDNQIYEVVGVEPFMKSFGIKGDNLGVLIKPKKR